MGEGIVLNALGVTYQFQRRFRKARQALTKSLKTRRGLDRARTLSSLGAVCSEMRALQESWVCHERSLEICVALDERCEEALTLSNLGRVCGFLHKETERQLRKRGDTLLRKARVRTETYLRQALDIRIMLGDRNGEAGVYSDLALMYYARKDWQNAQKYFEKRLQMAKDLKDDVGQARALYSLGDVHEQQAYLDPTSSEKLRRRMEDASNYYDQAIEVANDIGLSDDEQRARYNLARMSEFLTRQEVANERA